jgi:uncharacterized repeat protein (TIGR02543 family)
MKLTNILPQVRKVIAFLVFSFSISYSMFTQTWPTASELANQLTIGWNLGNSLEVPDGETAWGNPATTQQLIDAVKAAGFNTIRLPCAWDSYADQSTFDIDNNWLARVKEVIDYCINNNMYIIINTHWDGGWLEEHPLYSYQDAVNEKQEAYWTQIANYFIDYDEHLLFAGTNEVHADYGTPTTEHIEVQESYNQTFVDAVRATGGNNLNRILVVQTYNTNMWHGLDYFTLPTDNVSNRIIVETHYYDPYNFTLNQDNSAACTVWGTPWSSGDICSWGQESYVEDLFNRVKQEYIDQGIPVIIGEYGVVKRTSLSGSEYTDHIASRLYYLEYITDAAIRYGMIPYYWDNGHNGDMGLALFDRSSGSVVDQDALDALMEGAGVGDPNTNYTLTTSVSGSGSISLNPSGGIYAGGTVVSLTANPASGYEFVGWSGDLSGTTNPSSITITNNKSVTANFIEEGSGGSGTVLREYWSDITGESISNLTSNSDYPDSPTGSEQLTLFEGPTDWADNYGTRIRGYIHPPATGTYTFWVAGDDNTDLYLSIDDTPANASRIAYIEGWTNSREWTKYSTQTATANLVAGNKYYIEVLHKEASGGDNVAVAWQGPTISQSVIDGTFLSPYETGSSNQEQFTLNTSVSGTGTISLDPSYGTYDAGTTVTLTATPGTGWSFSGWGGDLSSTANPATITMNSNKTITASFTEIQSNQFTLSTSVNGSGTIYLSPSNSAYDEGTIVTLTAVPESGWQFDNWTGSLTSVSNPATITMTENASVTANFSETSSGSEPCDNPVRITVPYSHDGAGEYCWVTSADIGFVNSWNLDVLEINGVDLTNAWSNSLPEKIDGNYYIYYKGSFSWSHFEISSLKGAYTSKSEQSNTIQKTMAFPNPFSRSLNVLLSNPEEVKNIHVFDQSGRNILTLDKSKINESMEIGGSFDIGTYIIQIVMENKIQTINITKIIE